MADITAPHGDCGTTELHRREITLFAFEDITDQLEGCFEFICGHCGNIVLRSASTQEFDLLAAAGVRIVSTSAMLDDLL